jgi:hypothetical protein
MTPSQRERKLDPLEQLLRERRRRPVLVWSQPQTEQECVDYCRRLMHQPQPVRPMTAEEQRYVAWLETREGEAEMVRLWNEMGRTWEQPDSFWRDGEKSA